MNIFLGVIVGLLVLMLLVIAHEFGHFVMARKNGVRVLEFGIGFPPRAVAWIKDPETHKWRKLKRSEWETSGVMGTVTSKGKKAKTNDQKLIADGLVFSLNWLPIGGFCQMDGESAVDEREGTFGAASFWKKTKILFGGVAMNWLVAWIILTILAWTGMPQFLPGQFTVNADTRVEDSANIVVVSTDEEGNEVETPQKLSYSTWSAPIVGAGVTLQITGETFRGVGQLIWDLVSGVGRLFSFDDAVREGGQEALEEVKNSVQGPVGIVGQLFPMFTSAGINNLAFLAALISISLACMNVLPIPALDGGRWLLIAIYKIRKKELTQEMEQKIVSRAMLVLLALILVVTVLDVTKIITGLLQ